MCFLGNCKINYTYERFIDGERGRERERNNQNAEDDVLENELHMIENEHGAMYGEVIFSN